MQTTKRIIDLLPGTTIGFQKENFRRDPLLYNVTQVGRSVGGVNHSISRSGYDAFALFAVIEGKIGLDYDGETYVAGQGDLLFFDQSVPHTFKNAGTTPYITDFMYIFGGDTAQFFQTFYQKHGCVLHGYNASLLSDTANTVCASIIEGTEDKFQTSAKLYALLADLLRYCGESEYEDDIARAIGYLSENFAKNVNLDELSKMSYRSKYYFIRQFHARTGFTPKEYLANLRFDKSKELLLKTNISVKEIAEHVGFSDSRNLIKLYQKKLGLTPSQFRELSFGRQ